MTLKSLLSSVLSVFSVVKNFSLACNITSFRKIFNHREHGEHRGQERFGLYKKLCNQHNLYYSSTGNSHTRVN